MVTGAATLEGWQLGASRPPPAPDIGGLAQGSGLAPGQTLTLRFKTDRAYPTNGGGTLRVSADCIADVSFPVTGPAPPPPKPCKCAKLTLKLDPTLLTRQRVPPDRNNFGVGFTWRMTCSAGAGTCKATVLFLPPEIRAGSLPEPPTNLRLNIKRKTFVCVGPCAKSKVGKFPDQDALAGSAERTLRTDACLLGQDEVRRRHEDRAGQGQGQPERADEGGPLEGGSPVEREGSR